MPKQNKLSCYDALPRETQESFNKFVLYRDLKPHERSLGKVADMLNVNGNAQNRKKLLTSLGNLCTKWCWVERVKIYDADQQLKLAKKRESTFDGMSDVLLGNIEGLIKYANNLLGEVIERPYKDNGEKYSLVTRIKMTKDVSNLLKEAHELLCNLCGRPSTYSSLELDQKGELNLNQNVKIESEEEKLERYANYFKQIKEDIGDSTSEEVNK